jgi:DNA processing protein
MPGPDLQSWLLLSAVPGIGFQRFQALLRQFGSPQDVLGASYGQLLAVPRLGPAVAQSIATHRNHKFADRQLRLIRKHGVHVITCHDASYPTSLLQIYDPPPLLFTRGSLISDDNYAIAVVGTRRTSSYGRNMTDRFTAALCSLGYTVISGMARGTDTIAHRVTISSGGRTVAVLGSGLDVPYPPENHGLMEKVAENGAVISEYPMGTEPDAANFPQRNRIISGMSKGVLVVEAGQSSGALITARYALDQNREVFAVPGPLTSETSRGTNSLIRAGTAKLVQETSDIITELPPMSGTYGPRDPDPIPDKRNFCLTSEEDRLYQLIDGTPVHIDGLATAAASTSAKILSPLLSLELKGAVKQLPGKLFVRLTNG